MGWRTVVIETPGKLSYKNNRLLFRGDKDLQVFIPEIDTLMITSTQCMITSMLMCELIKYKVNIIFCDEKHNPFSQLLPLYGCHNSPKRLLEQRSWCEDNKIKAFNVIVKQKIRNQSALLKKIGKEQEAQMLLQYANEVVENDITNREGFAAKVYFNALFGMDFTRDKVCSINAALDYGYTVLLSCFNREIVALGYLTQDGLKHCNEFNQFNLSCDFIEPFRVIIDDFVYHNPPKGAIDGEYKRKLVSLLGNTIKLEKEYYITDAISTYVKRMTDAIRKGGVEQVVQYEF